MKIKILGYSLLVAASMFAKAASAADSTLVADFELQTNRNVINGFWYYVDDKGGLGNSKIISGDTTVHPVEFSAASFGEPAQGIIGYSGKMEYKMGTIRPRCNPADPKDTCTYSNEVTFGTNVVPEFGTVLNLTGATSMSFWAKATPPVKISIVYLTEDVKDYSWARAEIPVSGEWKRYTANFSGTTGFVFKGTWGATKDKNPNIAQTMAFNFAIQKTSNPGVNSGILLLDDLYIHGWKDPNAAGIRNVARPSLSKVLRASGDGKSLRFSVPAAYRNVAGTVAAVDLSGKTVARAAFVKGQENVSLSLPAQRASTAFLRVYTDSDAR